MLARRQLAYKQQTLKQQQLIHKQQAHKQLPLVHKTLSLQQTKNQKIKLIEETIEREIRPSLKNDGGDIELIDVVGNRVLVATRGTCAVCKASEQTLKNFVQTKLQELVWPELVVEDVSQ